jgi:hypothetical protein
MSTITKLTLVKLVSKQLLQMLGLNVSGMGNVFQDATLRMEKWCTPKLLGRFNYKPKNENIEKIKSWGTLLGS